MPIGHPFDAEIEDERAGWADDVVDGAIEFDDEVDVEPRDINVRDVQGVGWRGRIRTFNPLIQSQVPYRLATRQRMP